MNRTAEFKDKYNHAIDCMYDLFKHGRTIEDELAVKLDLARDEIFRIGSIAANEIGRDKKPQLFEEIKGICDRAINSTER